jgi:preprotein translocase subunit SecB
MMHFKDRGGFGTKTIASMILNGKFDPANIPPIDFTSIIS